LARIEKHTSPLLGWVAINPSAVLNRESFDNDDQLFIVILERSYLSAKAPRDGNNIISRKTTLMILLLLECLMWHMG
jgi:hypothetical protein